MTTLLKRHAVIPNPDTGIGKVCMWCGDQPDHMTTDVHQAQILAPLVKALKAEAWDQGKASNDTADLFNQDSTNPYRKAS